MSSTAACRNLRAMDMMWGRYGLSMINVFPTPRDGENWTFCPIEQAALPGCQRYRRDPLTVQSALHPVGRLMSVNAIVDAAPRPLPDPTTTARQGRDTDVAPGEIAVGVVIGRASEYFDFFVFGIASVLVFPSVFFPFLNRLDGALWRVRAVLAGVRRRDRIGTVAVHVRSQRALGPRHQADDRPVPAGQLRRPASRSCRATTPSACAAIVAARAVAHAARAWRWAARGTACRRCWR